MTVASAAGFRARRFYHKTPDGAAMLYAVATTTLGCTAAPCDSARRTPGMRHSSTWSSSAGSERAATFSIEALAKRVPAATSISAQPAASAARAEGLALHGGERVTGDRATALSHHGREQRVGLAGLDRPEARGGRFEALPERELRHVEEERPRRGREGRDERALRGELRVERLDLRPELTER